MLGLRADLDASTRVLNGSSNMKSFKFSERNTGRFHTSGISGGMKKHQKIKLQRETVEEIPEIVKLQKYLPKKIEIRQKEIEEDTKQLLELEAKLQEVCHRNSECHDGALSIC
jgi:hypothetical protein